MACVAQLAGALLGSADTAPPQHCKRTVFKAQSHSKSSLQKIKKMVQLLEGILAQDFEMSGYLAAQVSGQLSAYLAAQLSGQLSA